MPYRWSKLPLLEAFDLWLVEAPPSDFEEFITAASAGLRDKPMDFLRDYKACVDARLAAEPVKNVFSLGDPHEIRVTYWMKIAERFEAEINFRSCKSAKSAGNTERSTRGSDHEVVKRRSIVKQNHTKSARDLCKQFDFHQVPLPREWQDECSVPSWADAYNSQALKHRVEALISRDKKATAQQ